MKMRLTKTIWFVAIGAAMLLSPAPARAQGLITATVPFDFIAGDRRLPAGDYVISDSDDLAVLTIASVDRRNVTQVLTIPAPSDGTMEPPRLRFTAFDGQHFLAVVSMGTEVTREVPLTPAGMERELQAASAAALAAQ
jgi:hypothetical protein